MGLPPLSVQFDSALIQKYNAPIPRYTSYPPATELHDNFTELDLRGAIAASNDRRAPLSLYVHIPFCQSACYYCGCNVIITNHKPAAVPYLQYLEREIQQTAALVDRDRPVKQLHWGGGTPNYLSLEQVEFLWNVLHQHFTFDPAAECSIEVNPRYVDRNYIEGLRTIGFNRVSIGIQDFDPQVQSAVNRVQPEALLQQVMGWIKAAGFDSVNVDLIYGLPFQTLQTFTDTIHKTIALDPDRIAVFNFAYVPWIKPIQKQIAPETLPSPSEKLAILQRTIEELTRYNYEFIGMDHFAKPGDELAIAQRDRTLKRNFQGYTTQPETELLGFGITAISMLHDTYAQNHKELKDYYQAIDAGQLPVSKGFCLSPADILRREVIMEIMSHGHLDKREVGDRYGIHFDDYFAQELQDLQPLAADGLLKLEPDYLEVTPIGRLLVRNIACVFDAHTPLRDQRLSRSI